VSSGRPTSRWRWIDQLDEIRLGRRRLGFAPARVTTGHRLEVLRECGVPSDLVDFLSRYGGARYFGAKILSPSQMQPMYRYHPKRVRRTAPGVFVTIFSDVALPDAPRFSFALVADVDLLAERKPRTRVVAWNPVADWITQDHVASSFSSWLRWWYAFVLRKAKGSIVREAVTRT
jgi:hypothetical protein